jgi:monooxygenase
MSVEKLREIMSSRPEGCFVCSFSVSSTWDLFKYPGVRSDSDMMTLGFSFKPWTSEKMFAGAKEICDYMEETVDEFKLRDLIQFNSKVSHAAFDSTEARWSLKVERGGGADAKATAKVEDITCQFMLLCTGYYRYDAGFQPTWAGQSDFKGKLIHPQHWPEDLDYKNKKIVVIGSGATAVTLIPSLVEGGAGHTIMLQRSPSYIAPLPSLNWWHFLGKWLPATLAFFLVRWKNILYHIYLFVMCRTFPNVARSMLDAEVRKFLPASYAFETHLKPRYAPWDQRVCIDPDGKMFAAISAGKAEIVTDTIVKFNAKGIECTSGRMLEADIVVSATGLNMEYVGGIQISVDGNPLVMKDCFTYKGMMISGLPNAFSLVGYVYSSWTLKCELIAKRVVDILHHMASKSYRIAVPIPSRSLGVGQPFFDVSAGYVERARDACPKSTERSPWRLHQNYLKVGARDGQACAKAGMRLIDR